MYLTNVQVNFPIPDGLVLFALPGGRSPVLDGVDDSEFWVGRMGYAKVPPPPAGMVYVSVVDIPTDTTTLRTYPTLPDGEVWRVVGQGYGRHSLVLPNWCIAAVRHGSPIGPSRFDCRRDCLHSDGCCICNPTVWGLCLGGGCNWSSDRYRVPVALVDEGRCPCFVQCTLCADYAAPGNVHHTYDGQSACPDCVRRDYTECEHCASLVPDTDIGWHESECSESCENSCCYSAESGDLIQDYGYTPYLQFHGTGEYHLGLELELNTAYSPSTHRTAQALADHMGELVYLKDDSSISEGFEMVTHPMTFDYARSVNWSILDELRETYRVESSSDCGMHVHVSKTAFDTASHIYRWMRLIYRNASEMQRLARRTGSTYASFHNATKEWSIHHASVAKGGHRPRWGHAPWYMRTKGGLERQANYGDPGITQRYSAINVENEATFELRFFASTTRPTEVLAALGLVEASIEYTRQLSAHKVVAQKGLEFGAFTTWVKDNNTDDRYAALLSEIERLVH